MKGLPGDPTTGPDGCYRALVEYGWSGRVEPSKKSHAFEPSGRSYEEVTGECIHENYVVRHGRDKTTDANEAYPADQPVRRSVPLPRPLATARGLGIAPAVLIPLWDRPGQRELTEIEEDLRVMSCLLQQTLEGPSSPGEGVFDPVSKVSYLPTPSVQAIYIRDYGVVLSVWLGSSLPLVDQAKATPSPDPNGPRDPIWDRARRQVLADLAPADPGTGLSTSPVLDPGFQAKVVRCLRHASNIRHLAPESWVVIHLAADQTAVDPAQSEAMPAGGGRERAATVRIQKCHLDAFASGLLDENQLLRSVEVLVR